MIDVVWFKRDLRAHEHAPLAAAAAAGGPVVCLYVYEPELLGSPEWDRSHSDFIDESLADLDGALRGAGTRLTFRSGEMTAVLDRLWAELDSESDGGPMRLWSHEETGTGVTFARDRRVAAWCARRGVRWDETPQHGVVRGLRSRDGWAGRWAKRMNEPVAATPGSIRCVSSVRTGWDFGERRRPAELGVRGEPKPLAQRGGRSRGLAVLDSFLHDRGVNYRADMANPAAGFDGCSRLSAHLAYGTVSIRETHHALTARQRELRAMPAGERDGRWLPSLRSFEGRLRWHCHFMQKLESEPGIEFWNMNRAYDGMRTEDTAAWTEEERRRFEAWCAGRTGYPFVDACMRCLHATGWMNFRMRSMLVSFASYHLWLHWRPTAVFLARHFLDFEPGIHFSQFQMQSGVTGINTVRIYNPIKQSKDQDPGGAFIRRWVPELADVPAAHLHEPWKFEIDEAGSLFAAREGERCTPDGAYPPPIVDHATAYRLAKERVFAVRATAAAKREARRVYLAHGSRKRPGEPAYRGGPEDRGGGDVSGASVERRG